MAGASLSRSTGAELAPGREGARSPPSRPTPMIVTSGLVFADDNEDEGLRQVHAKEPSSVRAGNKETGSKRSRWSKLLGRRPGSSGVGVAGGGGEREPASLPRQRAAGAPSPPATSPPRSPPHWRRAAHAFDQEDQYQDQGRGTFGPGRSRATPSNLLQADGDAPPTASASTSMPPSHPLAPPQTLAPPPRRRASATLTDSARRRRRASAPQGTIDLFSPPITIIHGGGWGTGTVPRQGPITAGTRGHFLSGSGSASSRHSRGRHSHSLGALEDFGLGELVQSQEEQAQAPPPPSTVTYYREGGAAVGQEHGRSNWRGQDVDIIGEDDEEAPAAASAVRPSTASETRSSRPGTADEAPSWLRRRSHQTATSSASSDSSSSASVALSDGVRARLLGALSDGEAVDSHRHDDGEPVPAATARELVPSGLPGFGEPDQVLAPRAQLNEGGAGVQAANSRRDVDLAGSSSRGLSFSAPGAGATALASPNEPLGTTPALGVASLQAQAPLSAGNRRLLPIRPAEDEDKVDDADDDGRPIGSTRGGESLRDHEIMMGARMNKVPGLAGSTPQSGTGAAEAPVSPSRHAALARPRSSSVRIELDDAATAPASSSLSTLFHRSQQDADAEHIFRRGVDQSLYDMGPQRQRGPPPPPPPPRENDDGRWLTGGQALEQTEMRARVLTPAAGDAARDGDDTAREQRRRQSSGEEAADTSDGRRAAAANENNPHAQSALALALAVAPPASHRQPHNPIPIFTFAPPHHHNSRRSTLPLPPDAAQSGSQNVVTPLTSVRRTRQAGPLSQDVVSATPAPALPRGPSSPRLPSSPSLARRISAFAQRAVSPTFVHRRWSSSFSGSNPVAPSTAVVAQPQERPPPTLVEAPDTNQRSERERPNSTSAPAPRPRGSSFGRHLTPRYPSSGRSRPGIPSELLAAHNATLTPPAPPKKRRSRLLLQVRQNGSIKRSGDTDAPGPPPPSDHQGQETSPKSRDSFSPLARVTGLPEPEPQLEYRSSAAVYRALLGPLPRQRPDPASKARESPAWEDIPPIPGAWDPSTAGPTSLPPPPRSPSGSVGRRRGHPARSASQLSVLDLEPRQRSASSYLDSEPTPPLQQQSFSAVGEKLSLQDPHRSRHTQDRSSEAAQTSTVRSYASAASVLSDASKRLNRGHAVGSFSGGVQPRYSPPRRGGSAGRLLSKWSPSKRSPPRSLAERRPQVETTSSSRQPQLRPSGSVASSFALVDRPGGEDNTGPHGRQASEPSTLPKPEARSRRSAIPQPTSRRPRLLSLGSKKKGEQRKRQQEEQELKRQQKSEAQQQQASDSGTTDKTAFPASESASGPFFGALARIVPPRSRLSSLSQKRRGTKSHSSAIRPAEAEQAAVPSSSGLPSSSSGGLGAHPLVRGRLEAGPSNSSLRRTLSGGASSEIRARPYSHPAALEAQADGQSAASWHPFRRSIAEVPSSSATNPTHTTAQASIAPPPGMPSVAEAQQVASPASPVTRSISLQGPDAASSLHSYAQTARPRRGSSASRTSVANRSGLTRSGSKSEGLGAPSRSTILSHTHAPNASLVVQMDDRHGFVGVGTPETVREEENANTSREEDQDDTPTAAPTRAESNPKPSKLSTVRRIFRSRAKSDAATTSRNAPAPQMSQSTTVVASTAPKLPAVAGLDEFGRLGESSSSTPMMTSASAPGLAGRASNESYRRGRDSSFFGFRSRETKRSVDLRGVDHHPGPATSEPSRIIAARAGGVDAAPQRAGSRRERTAEEMYDEVAAEAGRPANSNGTGTVGSTGMRFLEEADALTPPLSPSKGESFLSASRPGSTTPSRAGFGSLRGSADRSLTLQALSISKGSRVGKQMREANARSTPTVLPSPITPSSLLARETLQSWQDQPEPYVEHNGQTNSQRNSDVPTVTGPVGSSDETAPEVGLALTAASPAPRGEQALGTGSGDGNSSRARTTSLPTRPTVPRIWQVSRNSKVLSPTGEFIDDHNEDADEDDDSWRDRGLSTHARTSTMLSGTSVTSYQTADSSLQPQGQSSARVGGTTLSNIETSREDNGAEVSREVISPLQELISSLEERHGTASNGGLAREGSGQIDGSFSTSNVRDASMSESTHSPYENDSEARHREAARRKRNTFGGAEGTPVRSVGRSSADDSPSKLHFPTQSTAGDSPQASGVYETHGGRELTVSEIESNLAAVEAALHDASIQGSFDPSSLRRRLAQPGLAGDTSLRSTVAASGSFDEESMMTQGNRSSGRVYLPPGSEFAIAHAVQQVRRAISSSHLPRIPSEDSNLIAEADGGKWQSSQDQADAPPSGPSAVASPRAAAGQPFASPFIGRSQQGESTPMRAARVRQESMQDVEQAYARMCELVGSAAGIIASPPSAGGHNRQSPWRRRSDHAAPPDHASPSLARVRTQSAAPAPASRYRSTLSEHHQLLRDSDALMTLPATSPIAPIALPEEPELRGRPSNLSTASRRAASESPRRATPGDRLEDLPDLKRNSNSHKRASIEPATSTSGSGGGASNSPTVTAKTQGTPRSLDAEQAHRQLSHSIDGWRISHGGSSQGHTGSHRRQGSEGGAVDESAASSSRDPFGGRSVTNSAVGGTTGHRSRASVGSGAALFGSIASPANRRGANNVGASGSMRDWSGEVSGRPMSRGSAVMRGSTMSREGSEVGERRPGSAFPIGSPVPSTMATMQRRHALERDSLLDSLERSRNENMDLRANNQQLQDDLHEEVTRVLELERELERSRERQTEMEARIMNLEEQLSSEHRDRLRIAELLERVQKAVDTAAAERNMGFSPSASSVSIVQEDLQPTSRRVFDIPSVLQPGPRPVTGDSSGHVSPPSMFAPERGGSSRMPAGEEHATPAQTSLGEGSFRSRSPSLHSIPSALGLDVQSHEMEWALADEEPLEDVSGAVADDEDPQSPASSSPFRPRPPRFAQREHGSTGTSTSTSSLAGKRDRTDRRISLDALSSLPQPRSTGSIAGTSSSGAGKRVSLPPSISNRTVMAMSNSLDGSAGGRMSGTVTPRVTASASTPANLATSSVVSSRILGKAGGSVPVSRYPSTAASQPTASVDTKSVGLAERFGYRGPTASRQISSASSAPGNVVNGPGDRQFSAASHFTTTSGEYTAVSDSPVGSFIATFGAEDQRGGGYYDPRRPSGYDPLKLPQSQELEDNSLD